MHELTRNMGKTWRYMVSDSQYRWLGPEKSITHLGVSGVLNAVWDLWGKILNKPVWKIVCDMSPEEIIGCVDFRYITDVITPEESIAMLKKTHRGKEERMKEAMENRAVPAYTTSPGWLAFSGERMHEVLKETIEAGYTTFKFKVGTNVEADREKLAAVRKVLGYDQGHQIMIDANQVRMIITTHMKIPWLIRSTTGMERSRGYRIHEAAGRVQTSLHRRAHQPRRRPGPRRNPQSAQAIRSRSRNG